jgi:hypothetical protein
MIEEDICLAGLIWECLSLLLKWMYPVFSFVIWFYNVKISCVLISLFDPLTLALYFHACSCCHKISWNLSLSSVLSSVSMPVNLHISDVLSSHATFPEHTMSWAWKSPIVLSLHSMIWYLQIVLPFVIVLLGSIYHLLTRLGWNLYITSMMCHEAVLHVWAHLGRVCGCCLLLDHELL